METIKEYKETIDLFGKKRKVTITIKIEPDPDAISTIADCDGFDTEEALKDYENGELSVDIIIVEIKCDLFSGHSSLGGCFIESESDYFREVEIYELVEYAIDDYKADVQRYMENFFKDFFGA